MISYSLGVSDAGTNGTPVKGHSGILKRYNLYYRYFQYIDVLILDFDDITLDYKWGLRYNTLSFLGDSDQDALYQTRYEQLSIFQSSRNEIKAT